MSIFNKKGEVVEFRSGGRRILWDREEKGLFGVLRGGLQPEEQIVNFACEFVTSRTTNF
jgi:hypothetical protein